MSYSVQASVSSYYLLFRVFFHFSILYKYLHVLLYVIALVPLLVASPGQAQTVLDGACA
jgi:hypothetical protein